MENEHLYDHGEGGESAARHACTFCSKTYAHHTSLSRHKRDYHPSSRKARQSPKPTTRFEMDTILKHHYLPFPCSLCSKSFIHKTSLSRHKRDYHPVERDVKRNSPAKYRCYSKHVGNRLKECRNELSRSSSAEQHGEKNNSFNLVEVKENQPISDGESAAANPKEELDTPVTADGNEEIVMWMYQEDPLDGDGFWNLFLSSDDKPV